MSWRNRLQPASFRGVPFYTESADAGLGRRTETHEYPGRDTPYTEDLGRRARTISVDAYVLGADYMAARDALIAAVESPGPATLVHPYWGALSVICTDCRVAESSREGGMARFSLSFAESGEDIYPAARTDTTAALTARADAARAAAQDAFAVEFALDGQPGWVADSAVSDFEAALGAVDDLTASLTPDFTALAELQLDAARVAGTIADLVRVPVTAAAQLSARIRALAQIPQRPADAFAALVALFGRDTPVRVATTPSNQRAALNRAATDALVRRLAIAEAAALLPAAEFTHYEEASTARDALLMALDAEQLRTVDDALYVRQAALAAGVTRVISARADSLARLGTVRFQATLPALVVAHRVYGDAARAPELVARNRVRHPGFVPGGADLEVAL